MRGGLRDSFSLTMLGLTGTISGLGGSATILGLAGKISGLGVSATMIGLTGTISDLGGSDRMGIGFKFY